GLQDHLTLNMSEDAWEGNAQFQLYVNGSAVGPVQTVTADHHNGEKQAFEYWGNFPPNTKFELVYLNDAWDPKSDGDRNLYLYSAQLNNENISDEKSYLLGGGHPIGFSPEGANKNSIIEGTSVALSGTSSSNTVIKLYLQDGSLLGTSTADATGAWSFTAHDLASGHYEVTATSSDVYGVTSSTSKAYDFIVDKNKQEVFTSKIDNMLMVAKNIKLSDFFPATKNYTDNNIFSYHEEKNNCTSSTINFVDQHHMILIPSKLFN
uniref:Ig-like domain-containing protein n=3 Tax=Neokomagataea TaxID=1223423 RepID=UPI001C3FB766